MNALSRVHKEGPEQDLEVKDPALFLKGVLREGVLQNKGGLSMAVEFGVLLHSTIEGERKSGFEGIGVLSGKVANIGYHLNLGLEFDREDSGLHNIWGVIVEYPFEGTLRFVGEVTGDIRDGSPPENSGLMGLICEVSRVSLDVGFRKGFSDEAPDWEITSGISFAF